MSKKTTSNPGRSSSAFAPFKSAASPTISMSGNRSSIVRSSKRS
jgi:hypothetical protein